MHYKIKSQGTSWEYYRQYKQLFSSVNGRYIDMNDNKEILKVLSIEPSHFPLLNLLQFHDASLVRQFGLRPSNINGKPVLNSDDLLVLQVFNVTYDAGVF